MSTEVFLDAVILVNGVEISGQTNELTINQSAEMLDETTFGATTRIRKGGLKVVSFEGSGFAEHGANTIDEVLFGTSGTDGVGESNVVTVFPKAITEGDTGAMGYAMRAVEENYNFGGSVGGLMAIDFTFLSKEIV
jgi:hypothetical protein